MNRTNCSVPLGEKRILLHAGPRPASKGALVEVSKRGIKIDGTPGGFVTWEELDEMRESLLS